MSASDRGVKDKVTLERVLYTAAIALFGGGQFVGVSLPTFQRAEVEETGRKEAWEAYYDERDQRKALQLEIDELEDELHDLQMDCR
jgi:hypothetical protein